MRPHGLTLIRMAIQSCEQEAFGEKSGISKVDNSESIMRLIWALVHSQNPSDVQRGIAMLEGYLLSLLVNPCIPSFSL
jgi:fission 1 protein